MGFIRQVSRDNKPEKKPSNGFFGISCLDNFLVHPEAVPLRSCLVISEPHLGTDQQQHQHLWNMSCTQQLLRSAAALHEPSVEWFDGLQGVWLPGLCLPTISTYTPTTKADEDRAPIDDSVRIAWRYMQQQQQQEAPPTPNLPQNCSDFSMGKFVTFNTSSEEAPSLVVFSNVRGREDLEMVLTWLKKANKKCLISVPSHANYAGLMTWVDCALQLMPFDAKTKKALGDEVTGLVKLVKPVFVALKPLIFPSTMGYRVKRRKWLLVEPLAMPPDLGQGEKQPDHSTLPCSLPSLDF